MKNELPLVCICLPCYNAEKTILETLESIRNQSYPNIEIHIFDNASTDKTVEIVKAVSDDRIYFHLAGSTGTAESNFTRCLNLGRGDYTALFHADDLYTSDMVKEEVQFLENHQHAGAVLTFANLINEDSEKMRTVFAPSYLELRRGQGDSFDLPYLFKAVLRENNFFFCPSALIRTKMCTRVLKEWRGGMFGPGADLDMWFRIAEAGKLGLINLPLLQYRISTSHFSHGYNKLNMNRADFFRIIDYWMVKPVVAACLDSEDKYWYQIWLMRDNVMRARNALRQGEVELARECLDHVSLGTMIKNSLGSFRGLKFLLLSMYVMLKVRLQ